MKQNDVCSKCGGIGLRSYANTTTWMGGIGGQSITEDTCDKCWGSGDDENPGPNLRRIMLKFRDDEDVVGIMRENSRLQRLLSNSDYILKKETDEGLLSRWTYKISREELQLLYKIGLTQ